MVKHEELFTSGAYTMMFRPDGNDNPFARIYELKRRAVVQAVDGRNHRVLDVGGGMGRMAVPLSLRHHVTLTDLSPQMLEQARPYAGRNLKLVVADARSLPFEDCSFDEVVCVDLIPHLPEPAAALREAHRVLVPGGRLIVDSTNANPLWTLGYPGYLGRNPRRWWRIWRGGGVGVEWQSRVWHYRKSAFLQMLAASHFRVLSVQGFGPAWAPKWHLAVAEPT